MSFFVVDLHFIIIIIVFVVLHAEECNIVFLCFTCASLIEDMTVLLLNMLLFIDLDAIY